MRKTRESAAKAPLAAKKLLAEGPRDARRTVHYTKPANERGKDRSHAGWVDMALDGVGWHLAALRVTSSRSRFGFSPRTSHRQEKK
jgi:hypothetical protein